MAEPVSQPIFFVVDEDPSAVEMLAGDLERRFQADYRVVGETSAAAALERLAALRDAGEQVALIICYKQTGLSNNGTASGDSELKAAGFAGGHQAALGSCGRSGTIREQTVC